MVITNQKQASKKNEKVTKIEQTVAHMKEPGSIIKSLHIEENGYS